MSSTTPQQYPANPYSPQSTLGPPNKPTGTPAAGGGGWKWLWIILGIGGFGLVACCGMCGGIVYFSMNAIKQSQPYQMAMTKVRENVDVKEKLGDPIEDSINFSAAPQNKPYRKGGLNMRFGVSVKGPKGNATVTVDASEQDGKWVLYDCTITYPDGSTQQLADAPVEEANTPDEEAGGEMKEEVSKEDAAPSP